MRVPALILSIGMVISGLVQTFVSIRAADGRLKRNRLAGIRTRATMESEETWQRAHQAARPYGTRAGQAFVLSGLIVVVPRVGIFLALLGIAIGIVMLYRSTRAGVRAVTPIARDEKKKS
jgi:uncharacterized membrane protein